MTVSNRRDTPTAFMGGAKTSLESSLVESDASTSTRQHPESLQVSPDNASSPDTTAQNTNPVGAFGILHTFRPRRTESGSVNSAKSSLRVSDVSEISLASDPQNGNIVDEENPQSGVRRSMEARSSKSATIPEEGEEHPIANFFRDRIQTFTHNIEVLTGRK